MIGLANQKNQNTVLSLAGWKPNLSSIWTIWYSTHKDLYRPLSATKQLLISASPNNDRQ